jgi:hypothetical protein
VALIVQLACAGPSPQPAITNAERAVRLAEDAEARRYAPQELGEARERLREAREMAESSSNYIEARRAAEKAEVDAELAVEKARAEELRLSLAELRRSIRAAGEEAGAAGSGSP